MKFPYGISDFYKLITEPLVQSKFSEAQAKLQKYHTQSTKKYGGQLRLRAYAVVALGFERVVWEEGKSLFTAMPNGGRT